MKSIKKYIFLLAILAFQISHSEDVNVARFEIQSDGVQDYLVVNFSFHTVEELFKDQIHLDNMKGREGLMDLKSKVVTYVKSNTNIRVNGEILEFGKGMIKLGNASFIRLEIKNMPKEIHSMNATISCFDGIFNQQNYLVFNVSDLKIKKTLSSVNDFNFVFGSTVGVEKSSPIEWWSISSFYILMIVVSILIFFLSIGKQGIGLSEARIQ